MPLKLPKVYSYVFNLLKTMLVINSHLNNCVRKNGVTITTKKIKSNLKDKEEFIIEVKGSKYSVFIDAAHF